MYIASISNDLKLHTWPSGQLNHTYKTSLQGYLKSISWSKEGSWLVLVPSKGPAEIVSVRDNIKLLHTIEDIQQPTCAAFQNTTKRNIALGTNTGIALIYDIKSKNTKKHFPRAPSTLFKVEYCAKDSFLAAACENGETLLYNSVTYNLSASYKLPNSKTVTAMCCHPTRRNLIAAGSQEGVVGVWDIHTSKLIYHTQAHAAAVTDLTFSPLRSDLIITTGYDRKFAFYDMSQRTSLVQSILERSPTAVEFCPDGVGIAVALQDGTINAYDTRQLNEPLYSFKAHNSQIKQLLFQKNVADSNSVDYTFVNDSNDSGDGVRTPGISDTSAQSFESVGHMFCGDVLPDIPEVPTDVGSELDAGDSFIDAIGLNSKNATANSARESLPSMSDGIKKMSHLFESSNRNSPVHKLTTENIQFQDMQRRSSEAFHSNKGMAHLHTALENVKAQETSTPKSTLGEVYPQITVSPLLHPASSQSALHQAGGDSVLNMTVEQFQAILKCTVQEEVATELTKFYNKINYDLMDVIAQMRRHFLDLQMSIIKEFVQLDSRIEKLGEYNVDNSFGEDCLIKENIQLRKELAALREDAVTNNTDD